MWIFVVHAIEYVCTQTDLGLYFHLYTCRGQVAVLPGAWQSGGSGRTGWVGVGLLSLHEIACSSVPVWLLLNLSKAI